MNSLRTFDPKVIAVLGEYVYALRDPRDKKIFYVGKGNQDRLFDHFNNADSARKNNGPWTTKLRRIVEIWEAGEDVDWFIVRRDLASSVTSSDIESAIIDALEISQNGPTLNEISGPGAVARGILNAQDVSALAAPSVNPSTPYDTVFVFPIHNALAQGRTEYDATRGWWPVSQQLRDCSNPIAVGISNGMSRGVFSVKKWTFERAFGKWQFDGAQILNHELDGKNWLTIISGAFGYWQRGNYLVIQFDAKGKCRFIRGSTDKSTWRSL